MRVCSYELLCDVTLPGNVICTASLKAGTVSAGKYFYVDVSDSGSTSPASIKNLRFVATAQDGATWKITGKGGMFRQPAVSTINTSAASQFFNKTKAHEDVHVSEWETLAAGVPKYFNEDTFYDRIKGFTANTKDKLLNKVVEEYNKYFAEQSAAFEVQFGKTRALEKRAYHAEYDIEPKGVRERSDTWIETEYPE